MPQSPPSMATDGSGIEEVSPDSSAARRTGEIPAINKTTKEEVFRNRFIFLGDGPECRASSPKKSTKKTIILIAFLLVKIP